MLAEQMVEERVAAALAAALAAAPAVAARVIPSWREGPEGAAPDSAPPPSGCAIYVGVSPRSYAEYTSRVCGVSVAVGAVFPWESYPDRRGIAAATARIFGLLEEWNASHVSARDALTVPGIFRCDGVRLSGGQRADNTQERATAVTQTLEALGVMLPPTHTQ
jgi:hypothetical protein